MVSLACFMEFFRLFEMAFLSVGVDILLTLLSASLDVNWKMHFLSRFYKSFSGDL
jgi:hypothetical protein